VFLVVNLIHNKANHGKTAQHDTHVLHHTYPHGNALYSNLHHDLSYCNSMKVRRNCEHAVSRIGSSSLAATDAVDVEPARAAVLSLKVGV
jgi:hypothetical protein